MRHSVLHIKGDWGLRTLNGGVDTLRSAIDNTNNVAVKHLIIDCPLEPRGGSGSEDDGVDDNGLSSALFVRIVQHRGDLEKLTIKGAANGFFPFRTDGFKSHTAIIYPGVALTCERWMWMLLLHMTLPRQKAALPCY